MKTFFQFIFLVSFVSGTALYLNAQYKTVQTLKKNCRLDADDDGINDCYDVCPYTPEGARVDSKGCPRDTDADGVPDFKDKQLITPTECQPSDTNGVGDCNKLKY